MNEDMSLKDMIEMIDHVCKLTNGILAIPWIHKEETLQITRILQVYLKNYSKAIYELKKSQFDAYSDKIKLYTTQLRALLEEETKYGV